MIKYHSETPEGSGHSGEEGREQRGSLWRDMREGDSLSPGNEQQGAKIKPRISWSYKRSKIISKKRFIWFKENTTFATCFCREKKKKL